jgi:single-stranded-DNA-specific exonuclease
MADYYKLIKILRDAKEKGLKIGIFGDYDVDGVTSATILSTFLEGCGYDVAVRVATREAGYGIGVADADALISEGAQVVLMADLGTSDVETLLYLREKGIITAIMDHHVVPDERPPVDAFINPHQDACHFPFKGLCSAGVSFYVCAGLASALRAEGMETPDPKELLDLAAIGTVCDMMPLQEENRILVAAGLRYMQARSRPGIAALLHKARVDDAEEITEETIGFLLGPRINSPGRLGSAEPALSLLRAGDIKEALQLAETVEDLNTRRRDLKAVVERESYDILSMDPETKSKSGIVVWSDNWVGGVVGIAANGVVNRFQRPAIILANDPEKGTAHGSARTCHDVDVRQALVACEHLLERYGGHKAAAGLTIRTENLEAFAVAFDKACRAQLGDAPDAVDKVVVDCELKIADITMRTCQDIRSGGPYGQAFERPLFISTGCRVVGRRLLTKGKHVALTLAQPGGKTIDAIAFNMGDVAPELESTIDVTFVPMIDMWGGRAKVKMRVDRFWPSTKKPEPVVLDDPWKDYW